MAALATRARNVWQRLRERHGTALLLDTFECTGSDAYIEEWRQVSSDVEGNLDEAAEAAAAALDAAFDDQRLERMVKAGGVAVD